jgi:hypothetical protein
MRTRARTLILPPAFKWLLRSGRGLAPRRLRLSLRSAGTRSSSTPAHRQRPALFVLLKEGKNASLEAMNKALLCAKTAEEKTLQTAKKSRLSVSQLILHQYVFSSLKLLLNTATIWNY